MKKPDSIEMTVAGLTLDQVTRTPIVVLKDPENRLHLPIWIGLLEATALATELEGIKMSRPMTHDLLKNILNEVGGNVTFIEITELKDNTYYALVTFDLAGREVAVDSRPSDQDSNVGASSGGVKDAHGCNGRSSTLHPSEAVGLRPGDQPE